MVEIEFTSHQLAVVFGILGNIVGFIVFLAPIPTFYKICKRKSSEGYHSIPYAVALFSAVLLLYYGALKTNGTLIITINSIGCVIESIYLIVYLVYATPQAKSSTLKLLFLFDLGGCSTVIIITRFFINGSKRVTVVGWICAIINICVFVSPLSIMKRVIKTRSVEFMPFTLICFLTLNATVWFFYGFYVHDYFLATPNILGFLLGLVQMILYAIYKGSSKQHNETNSSRTMVERTEGSGKKPSEHTSLDIDSVNRRQP